MRRTDELLEGCGHLGGDGGPQVVLGGLDDDREAEGDLRVLRVGPGILARQHPREQLPQDYRNTTITCAYVCCVVCVVCCVCCVCWEQ